VHTVWTQQIIFYCMQMAGTKLPLNKNMDTQRDEWHNHLWSHTTRKLTYHKDNRAMRPIYRCPENFWESPSTQTATFAEIFNRLLFQLILWMCVQYLKFIPLHIPEMTAVLKKFGQSLNTPMLPFLRNFSWAFVRMYPVNVTAKFAVRSFTSSWENSDCSFGCGLRIQI